MAGEKFDTTDVDRWIGVPLGGGVPQGPDRPERHPALGAGDAEPEPALLRRGLRRGEGRFGRLVGPQSFAVCTDDSHGAAPAIQGHIPGTHMLFGGDEWWFYGPRIEPGDRIRHERMLFDYKLTETKFAGPTMFSRGDTTYVNQQRRDRLQAALDLDPLPRGPRARARPVHRARRRRAGATTSSKEIEHQKFEYYQSFLELKHERRLFVKKGDKLPRRPIGPHTLMSFTTEWRAYLMTVWGAFQDSGGPTSLWNAGWLPEMSRDLRGREDRPDAQRRPLPRPLARPRAGALRAADRPAARLRLRRLDGRVDPRLPLELGGEWGEIAAQQDVLPLAGVHRRRHVHRRRGRGGQRRPPRRPAASRA